MTIRLGIWGAGIFTRNQHIPNILNLGQTYTVTAICARTETSTQAASDLLPYDVQQFQSVDAFLAYPDIDAFLIVVPIPLLPDAIKQALATGKHVLSEKPIAPTAAEGQSLIEHYQANHAGQIWMVAENWRFAPTIQRAKQIIADGRLGKLTMFHWAVYANVTPDNQYYQTKWRQNPDYQGGFLFDGGIHLAAGLREVLGDVETVYSIGALQRKELAPQDTLAATLRMKSGIVGTLAVTYASSIFENTSLTISGTNGVLTVNRESLKLTNAEGVQLEFADQANGVQAELATFASLIDEQNFDQVQHYLMAAYHDVMLIEAMLYNRTR